MLRPLTPGQTSTHYERVIARRPPEELAATGVDLGVLALGDALRNQQNGTLDHLNRSGLEGIANLEIRVKFENSYELTSRMMNYISMQAPTPEDMAAEGADHVFLSGEFERMNAAGLEPHIILAPHGLGLEGEYGWEQVYARATADSSIPGNPLKDPGDRAGLWVGDAAKDNWDTFDKAPQETSTPGAATLPILETITPDGRTVQWTIRIIPGTAMPQNLNADYNGVTYDTNGKPTSTPATSARHQTIPELLTDKLTFIMKGEIPTDISTEWGDNGDRSRMGAAAPSGGWGSGDGRVFVYWNVIVSRGGDFGRRRPVG